MELTTANAVFRSAMKIPAFVAKPILSCFLFLFACFLFLLITPNLTKAAYAASCRVNTTISIPQGFTINVGTDGVDTSLSTQLVLNPGANRLGPIKVDSTSGATAADYVVNVSIGTYNAVVVVGNGAAAYYILCDGGTDGSGGVVVTPASTPPPAVCTYRFTPQGSVSAGGTVNVEITRIDPPGTSSDTIEAGFAQGANRSQQQTRTGTGPIPLTAPTTAGNYLIYATDTTTGGLCALESGSSAITVTGGSPTPTPQPTPGTGCNIVPSNTSWDPLVANVSGNTVVFKLPKDPGGQVGIIVEKDSDGSLAVDSKALPAGTLSWPWTAPDGSYCAAIFYGTAAVSTVIHFTVPSGATGDTCSSASLMWVNDVRCRAIGGGWFDSDVFTLGQSALTLDSLNTMLWGQSQLLPKVNSVTANRGALALTGQVVASLYSAPPASGVQYFAQKVHDLNPVQPAYAAAGGIGYQALGPVQKIWIAFRNIAYVGFIIVFVVMGFMIMFRAHISPQAVATVQDSIPRLVIALILVTFSYAIAGFMIDIMFLILNVAVQALVSTKLVGNADFIFNDNVFTVIWSNWSSIFANVAGAIRDIIKDALSLPGWMETLFGWTGGTIAGLVIGIALLFIMFRIFLMLLMAYVMIILLTMFAPFFFLIQALPGNNGAKEWFKQMASNISVFPTVALMFILAGIMGGMTKLGAASGTPVIQPGQVGQFPLIIGGLNPQAIGQLIGIGFLLMTPSAADIVKNAFGGKGQGGPMGAFAPGAAAIGASAGFLGRRASQSSVGRAISDTAEIGGQRRAARLANFIPAPFRGGQTVQAPDATIRGRLRKD